MKSLISFYIEYQLQIFIICGLVVAFVLWKIPVVRKISGIFTKLSNRMIALLTLMVLLPLVGYGLYFVFGLNIGVVEVKITNGANVLVSLKRADVSIVEKMCSDLCVFAGVPAGSYTIVYSGNGIEENRENIELGRNDTVRRSFAPMNKIALIPTDKTVITQSSNPDSPLTFAGVFRGKEYGLSEKPFGFYDANGGDQIKLYEGRSITAYLTGSVAYGYFVTTTSDKSIHILDLASLKTYDLPAPDESPVLSVKSIGKANNLLIESVTSAWLLDTIRMKTTEVKLYDDLAMSARGTLIGLIRSQSTSKRSLLNLESRTGDILIDTTRTDSKRVLMDGLSGIKHIHTVGGKFMVEYTSGEWANISGIQ